MRSSTGIFTLCALMIAFLTSCEKPEVGAERANHENDLPARKARAQNRTHAREINLRSLTQKDMDRLEKMLLSMDDGQRRQLLVEARDIRSAEMRTLVMAKIYFTGKTGKDFLKTVEAVKSDLGPGSLRIEVLRQGILDGSVSSETATQLFLSLDSQERSQLSDEIAGKLELTDLLSMPNSGNLLQIEGMEDLLASSAALRAKALSESGENRIKGSIAADLDNISKSAAAAGGIEIYLAKISNTLPFETFQVLLDPKNSRLLEEEEFIGQLTESMARQNARQAISVLQEAGLMTTDLLKKSLWHWTKSDSVESIEWLRNNNQLSADDLDGGYTTIADANKSQKNFPTAWEAINSISDPVKKRQAEGRVWEAERYSVLEKVHSDPSGTIDSIVKGTSNFSEYWIEGAMDAWMERDFENAHAWYQANWNSMPADKSQYMAASFAKQSLEQGDTDAAREWAKRITHPKTRDRIDTKIGEALQKQ